MRWLLGSLMASQCPKRVCGVGNSEVLPYGLLVVGFCSTDWKMRPCPPNWDVKVFTKQMVAGASGECQEELRDAVVRSGRSVNLCEGVGVGRTWRLRLLWPFNLRIMKFYLFVKRQEFTSC